MFMNLFGYFADIDPLSETVGGGARNLTLTLSLQCGDFLPLHLMIEICSYKSALVEPLALPLTTSAPGSCGGTEKEDQRHL